MSLGSEIPFHYFTLNSQFWSTASSAVRRSFAFCLFIFNLLIGGYKFIHKFINFAVVAMSKNLSEQKISPNGVSVKIAITFFLNFMLGNLT